MGVPYRFHLAMTDSTFRKFLGAGEGSQWICRRTVIWSKSLVCVDTQRGEGTAMPEPTLDLPDEVRDRPPEPTPEHVAKADSLTRVIRDEELRKVVSKAVAMSLSRDDNDRSFC